MKHFKIWYNWFGFVRDKQWRIQYPNFYNNNRIAVDYHVVNHLISLFYVQRPIFIGIRQKAAVAKVNCTWKILTINLIWNNLPLYNDSAIAIGPYQVVESSQIDRITKILANFKCVSFLSKTVDLFIVWQ